MVAKKSRLKSRRSGAYGSMQEQVYDYLLKGIKSNLYQQDDILPSIREIAKHFGNSITPVNQALRKLEGEGYIERIHGVGVRVRSAVSLQPSIRTKPSLHFISLLKNAHLSKPNLEETTHHDTIQQWLLHHLSSCRDIHFSLASCEGLEDYPGFRQLLRDALDLRPSVLTFACPRFLQDDELHLLEKIHQQGTHIVYFGSHNMLPYADCVRSNFAQGQYDLTTFLLNGGRKRPVRIVTSFDRLYEQFKQEGFIRAMEDAGYSADQIAKLTYALPEDFLPHPHESAAVWLLPLEAILKLKPDAIMLPTDLYYGHVRVALHKMGVKQDILCTGYDHTWSHCFKSVPNYFSQYGDNDPYIVRNIITPEKPPISVERIFPDMSRIMAELAISRALGQLPPEPQMRLVPQRLVIPPQF